MQRLALPLAVLALACNGIIGDEGPEADPPPIDEPLACDGLDAPRHRLVRLTREQYDRTVSDLLGVTVDLARSFPEDEAVAGFAAPASIDANLARGYWDAAEAASEIASTRLDALAPCDPSSGAPCAGAFIDAFGRRAFRRPVEATERADYLALYEETVADGATPGEGLVAIVHAMLVSPSFLFRVEMPPAAGPEPVGAWELASRLSYFLWGTMPDDALFDRAQDSTLTDPDVLAREVDRMLADDRTRWAVRRFTSEWLSLGEIDRIAFDPALLPGVETDEAQAAFRERLEEQTLAFVEQAFFDSERGDFDELLTGHTFPVDDALAPLFGLPATGRASFEPTELPPEERSGFLSLPAVLMAHGGSYSGDTSPIKRGVWLLDRVLCESHPAPLDRLPDYCSLPCDGTCASGFSCLDGICVDDGAPTCSTDDDCNAGASALPMRECRAAIGRCVPNPDICIPVRTGDQTTREWWDSFGSTCHGCHREINGVGYTLEHYDGLGRFRETQRTSEGDEPIDARGELVGVAEIEGLPGLVGVARETGLASDCYASSWFVFAFAQVPGEHHGARCAEREIADAFREGGLGLRGLLRSIALSDAFRHSAPPESETDGGGR